MNYGRARHSVAAFAGIPILIKNLFDVQGEITTAGSVVPQNATPAKGDASPAGRRRLHPYRAHEHNLG
jgi:aspartyl-tRNA(Asn)/glutamyl-tRNA(Gln) amidotransferase subunit A